VPTFAYQALNAAGQRVAGEIDALDARMAIRRLQDTGLVPIDAQPAAARAGSGSGRAGGKRGSVKAREVTQVTRELATLIGAGQTVEGSLEMAVADLPSRRLAAALSRVLEQVRTGSSLSDAMGQEPQTFGHLYVAMVRAGEASGRLEETLDELASMRERAEALKSKLISALIYPALIVLTSLGALTLLLTLVVPQFEPLFDQAGEKLPASTRVVLMAAKFIRTQGTLILLVLLVALLLLSWALRQPGPRRALDRLLLTIPGIGRLIRERITAQLTRGLASLLAGGLDLPTALMMSRDLVANHWVQAAMERVIQGVRQGRSLSDCLAESGVLVPMAVKMLRVGEESGRLKIVAAHLADAFEERVATRLGRLVAVIEPVLVIVLGILVGGIVMSILSAVISVNDLAV
jgi:general secretion pathway protein F